MSDLGEFVSWGALGGAAIALVKSSFRRNVDTHDAQFSEVRETLKAVAAKLDALASDTRIVFERLGGVDTRFRQVETRADEQAKAHREALREIKDEVKAELDELRVLFKRGGRK